MSNLIEEIILGIEAHGLNAKPMLADAKKLVQAIGGNPDLVDFSTNENNFTIYMVALLARANSKGDQV